MIYWLLFLMGLTIGSFLNVVIFRLRFGGSALEGRSKCDHCKKLIPWYDNIPLLSYVLLQGKCRKCKKPIPRTYPIIELLVGLQFVWVFWLLKTNFNFFGQVEGFYSLGLLIYWLILFSGSLGIAIYDFKYMLIPDEILAVMISAAAIRLFFSSQWQVLGVALASSLFLYGLHLLTKGKGMGIGDVKLAFLMGLVLGWPMIVVAYFLAFLTGAGVGVILVFRGIKKLKAKIAFGPFLLLGMLITKLWGWRLWYWYLGLL